MTPDGAHCSASYNPASGVVTYTPSPSTYVGTDVATFTFTVEGVGDVTVNNCLEWTTGSSDVNPFAFTPLIDQPLSTLVYSGTAGVSGNTIPAPISISAGGEYAVNGGSWTSASGTVNSGDTVQVRQTTSASNNTETIVTLTIDGQSAPFSTTTTSVVGAGYIAVAVDSFAYGYAILSVLGADLPAGIDDCYVSPGETRYYSFSGTVPIQTMTVNILVGAELPDMEIQVYYSSDASTEHTAITTSGDYNVPLTKDVVEPDYAVITIIQNP